MEYSQLKLISGNSVFFSWAVFGIVFMFFLVRHITRKKYPGPDSKKRNTGSVIGLILQSAGFWIMFSFHRKPDITVQHPSIFLYIMNWLAVFMAPLSVIFSIYSILSLGKQWSLSARVISGHNLITSGPFRLVRHPIYFSLFVLFISTGIIGTATLAFIISAVFYIYGTRFRIREEEKLMVDQFGEKYIDYSKKVRAFIPFIY